MTDAATPRTKAKARDTFEFAMTPQVFKFAHGLSLETPGVLGSVIRPILEGIVAEAKETDKPITGVSGLRERFKELTGSSVADQTFRDWLKKCNISVERRATITLG